MKQSNITYKQTYHFLDNGPKTEEYSPSVYHEPKINTSIKENPYKQNVEIEKDEIVLRPDLSAVHKAGGKKHSQGGTGVFLPEDSFVFSDDKSLAFNKKDIELFELKPGAKYRPKNNTPAKVLERNIDMKHYNSLVAIIEDPNKDKVAKDSATAMMDKYMKTLGNIAYVQEQKKMFPDGIPEFSMGTAPVYDADLKEEIMEQKQYMKYGGKVGTDNPYLPKMQDGGPTPKVVEFTTPEGRKIKIDLNNKKGSTYFGTINGKRATFGPDAVAFYMKNYDTGVSGRQSTGVPQSGRTSTGNRATSIARNNVEVPEQETHSGRTSTGNRNTTTPTQPINPNMAWNKVIPNPFANSQTAPVVAQTTVPVQSTTQAAPSTTTQTTSAPTTEDIAAQVINGAVGATGNTGRIPNTGNPYVPQQRPDGSLFGPIWSQLVKDNPDAFILSPEAQKSLPQYFPHSQHKRTSGMYGEADWNTEDFKNRHQWYFKDKQNFDFKNEKDVLDFQNAYNKKATELGYKNYFVGQKGKATQAADGYFGEYTYNAPGFKDKPATPPQTPPSTTDTTTQPPKSEDPNLKPGEVNGDAQNGVEVGWQFTPWQRRSHLYNAAKWAMVDREMPIRSQEVPVHLRSKLLNPEQQIADMKAVTNTQMRGADLQSPILANAQKSAAFGDLLDRIPGVRSAVDNQNVGIQNQTAQYNVGLDNNTIAKNAAYDQQYWQQAAVGRQNFKNMRTYMADQWANNVFADASTNTAMANEMMALGPKPAYGFDWKTGNYYRNDKNIKDVQSHTSGDTMEAMADYAEKLYNRGIPPEIISSMIKSKTFSTMAPYLGQQPTFGTIMKQKKGGKVKNPYK